jgi:8-oxo-dGTP pyrophosphatase MutT (NUDIX family)
MKPLRQCAAIPYVEVGGAVLVLLITTRGTGRWTVPKGWPKRGMGDAELAAQEAFEEAGVAGEITPKPIGSFEYTKRLHLFAWIRCRVAVYLLRADRQYLSWPEKESRNLRWVAPSMAATMVRERQLSALLNALEPATQEPE